MIKRINQYLLTHYPLVWNTRLIWMLAANFILHLLFSTGGFTAVSVTTISTYNSLGSIGNEEMYVMSVLCGLVMLIVWCIFFLRNNAFKSFYRLGKWYLAKEFVFIFIILFTSANYFMSFNWGVRTKVRSFTNAAQLREEMKIVNTAAPYLPIEKSDYFILNNCDEKRKREATSNYAPNITTFDTAYQMDVPDAITELDTTEQKRRESDQRLKEAMRRTDAFSYRNYCKKLVDWYDSSTTTADFSATNRRWLTGHHKDSVRQAFLAFYKVLDKYKFEYQLNSDTIINQVFADSSFTLGQLVSNSKFDNINGYEVPNDTYLNYYDLNNLFGSLQNSQLTIDNFKDRMEEWTITAYVVLSLSILLLCYRRFTRKVFLISVIGTIIWAIIIGLLAASNHSGNGFYFMMLVLAFTFLIIGLASLKGSNKRLAGVCLNWHVYLVPFILMLVVGMINTYHRNLSYGYYTPSYTDEYLHQHYPFSSWVVNHTTTILEVNLLISFLYVAFLFNQWAKRWQAMPEE